MRRLPRPSGARRVRRHRRAGMRLPRPARRPVPPLRHWSAPPRSMGAGNGQTPSPHRGRSRRRCVRSETAAMAGLPPRARRVCPRPSEANVPRALARLACQATASWPCKGGVSGNSGVISYLAAVLGPAADHRPKADGGDCPNGHGARGRARHEASQGADGAPGRPGPGDLHGGLASLGWRSRVRNGPAGRFPPVKRPSPE